MRVQLLAQLTEGDAFDECNFSHQHIAARQFVQQLQGIDSTGDFIIPRLDGRFGASKFAQCGKHTWLDADTGGTDVLRRAPQTAAGRHLEFDPLTR